MHPHPTRRDVTMHMNAMMPIHIINSYGSYTIIFHIIQPLMLTHQFNMHQHIIFHTIHAIQFKQIHTDIFGPTSKLGLFLTVPHQSMGCPWTAPLIMHRFYFLEPKSVALLGLTTPKTIVLDFKQAKPIFCMIRGLLFTSFCKS